MDWEDYHKKKCARFSPLNEVKKKWELFINNTLKQNIDFETIIKVIYDFLPPVYSTILVEGEFSKVWNQMEMNYSSL